jgi:hypothetical protein
MPYFKNDNVNLLHIHIPKTGGTSVQTYFSSIYKIPLNNKSLFFFINDNEKIKHNLQIDSSLQHISYVTMVKYKDYFNINFENIQMITVVRNPYDRIVSALFFIKRIHTNSTKEDVFREINLFLSSKLVDNHNLPQYRFIIDETGEIVPNIKILRTETLNADMHALGYTDFDTRTNVNHHKTDYYSYLNNESIQLINEVYDEDFKRFNYPKLNV